jgi:hypothetical protein
VADSALTPELALDYLQELSTDVRAAVLLGGAGRLVAAGPDAEGERGERMGELVGELFERADVAAAGGSRVEQVEVTLAAGAVFAVRGAHWTLAVVANRYALPSLMFYDLRSVIHDLGGERP